MKIGPYNRCGISRWVQFNSVTFLAPLIGIRAALILTPIVHICKYVYKSASFSGQLVLHVAVEYYSIFKCDSHDKAGKNSETKYMPLVQVLQ